ncbi:Pentatricopeptide repeat-containing protein -mitochondrial [Striga hermonthica]|uniref:Pentatricopeptide repeat-containing protein -mitochondrial n=1 Tax=Striga hermonthica TaxID=68872 RepID=A0A9N7MRF8_STRHE|nr:Pentatricopeptide repeat-containing protein -mitochondrial [Striga hermonthica]
MLSKLKHLYPLSRSQARSCLNSYKQDHFLYDYSRVTIPLHNAFSSTGEPLLTGEKPTSEESPELPGWVMNPVKFKMDNKPENGDFVPPSLSYWIEDHMSVVKEDDMKIIVNDIIESDVDKISSILKSSQFKSPDLVIEALEGCDVDLSEDLVEEILCRFSHEWVPSLGFFKWAESRNGFKHPPGIYNLLIDNLGKAKKFEKMWELAEEMKMLEGYFTLDTMMKIMRRLVTGRKYEDAIEAFKSIESFGIEKDITALNILIYTLVKQGSVEHAEGVYFKFKDNIPPTKHTYNMLVHGWCRIGQIETARKTVDEMRAHGFRPDTVTYTRFIQSYCHEKDFRKVDSTLVEMERDGINPDMVTYTIMVQAYGKAKEINKAMEIYALMKTYNCSPNALFYTAFISALSRAGRVKEAEEVFDDMSKQGVVPDVETYNMLIMIAYKGSQEEKALNLLKKMEENKCRPNIYTYSPLLKMCCRLGRMKVLSFLLGHMFKNDVSLDQWTYSLLVRWLCGSKNVAKACSFFEEMVDKGFVLKGSAYKILVKALDKKGLNEEKERVKKVMNRAKEGLSRS